MKKKFFLALLTLLFVNTSFSQTTTKTLVKDANAEKRVVTGFNGIQVSSAIILYLSQGNEDAVAVSCSDASETKNIKTEVSNGILKISLSSGTWNSWSWKDKKVKAYVSVKNIDYIRASGASSIIISEEIKLDKLKLELSGASTLKGNIKVNNAKFNLSGASSITVSGIANTFKIEASGASSFKGFSFISDNCIAEASGASSININVTKELKAEASGASNIKYIGDPTLVDANATGASSIKKKLN